MCDCYILKDLVYLLYRNVCEGYVVDVGVIFSRILYSWNIIFLLKMLKKKFVQI